MGVSLCETFRRPGPRQKLSQGGGGRVSVTALRCRPCGAVTDAGAVPGVSLAPP